MTLDTDSDGWYYDYKTETQAWTYGKEIWCNLEGRYMHMVADMSQQVASSLVSNKVSVCSLGVYGTKYVRVGDQAPTQIEVIKG